MHRILRIVLAMASMTVGYFGIYRPVQLRWGATDEEVRRAMPGDEFQAHPVFPATRAITVYAPAERIWPWLVQMGYRRAGWYGYDWVDNDGIASSDKILPKWQSLKPGDTLPIWRGIDFRVVQVEPSRSLVITSFEGHDSMALGLYPKGPGETRLIWRIRLAPYRWASPMIVPQLFADLADFISIRQSLEGIRRRAEGVPTRTRYLYVELLLWIGMFLGFLAALVVLIGGRALIKPLLVAILFGLVTVACVLLRPPLFVDFGGFVAILPALSPPFRTREKEMPQSPPAAV